MTTIVAIDPGKHASGVAVFQDGELVEVAYTNDAEALAYYRGRVDRVVIEAPRIYDIRRWKGDPNDLVDIAIAGAALAGSVLPAELKPVRPDGWKGQTPKKIQNKRTLKALTDGERELLEGAATASKLHNVIDAVGIGLWELKRAT